MTPDSFSSCELGGVWARDLVQSVEHRNNGYKTRAENNYSLPFFLLYAQTCIPCVSFVEVFCSEDDDTQFLALGSVAQGDEHRAKVLSHLQQGRKTFIELACPTIQFLTV